MQAADIKQTAAGVRWYQPTLAGIAAHMDHIAQLGKLAANPRQHRTVVMVADRGRRS